MNLNIPRWYIENINTRTSIIFWLSDPDKFHIFKWLIDKTKRIDPESLSIFFYPDCKIDYLDYLHSHGLPMEKIIEKMLDRGDYYNYRTNIIIILIWSLTKNIDIIHHKIITLIKCCKKQQTNLEYLSCEGTKCMYCWLCGNNISQECYQKMLKWMIIMVRIYKLHGQCWKFFLSKEKII